MPLQGANRSSHENLRYIQRTRPQHQGASKGFRSAGEGMLVQSKKGFLPIGETITGFMEEMVSDVNSEKWIVFRCREEGIIIITPIYWTGKNTPM